MDKHTDHEQAKTDVLVNLDAENKQFHVLHDGELLRSLDIQGLQGPASMPFQDYLAQMKEAPLVGLVSSRGSSFLRAAISLIELHTFVKRAVASTLELVLHLEGKRRAKGALFQ